MSMSSNLHCSPDEKLVNEKNVIPGTYECSYLVVSSNHFRRRYESSYGSVTLKHESERCVFSHMYTCVYN